VQLKAYVGGVSWNIDDQALHEAFARFGECEAKIMQDKYTGRSRGFGFVTYQVCIQGSATGSSRLGNVVRLGSKACLCAEGDKRIARDSASKFCMGSAFAAPLRSPQLEIPCVPHLHLSMSVSTCCCSRACRLY
jgi:hypothetical protein